MFTVNMSGPLRRLHQPRAVTELTPAPDMPDSFMLPFRVACLIREHVAVRETAVLRCICPSWLRILLDFT